MVTVTLAHEEHIPHTRYTKIQIYRYVTASSKCLHATKVQNSRVFSNLRRLRNSIGIRLFLGGIVRLTMLDARISARFGMDVLTFFFMPSYIYAKSAGVTHTRTLTKNIQESSLCMRY